MPLATEQINAIHQRWCHRLFLDNYQEICVNSLFHKQYESFSAHLYELLHINRYFLEIDLKVHQGVSLMVSKQGFQPDHSTLVHIFNLAMQESALSFTAFKTGTRMTIREETGKIDIIMEMPDHHQKLYTVNRILLWDNKNQRNLLVHDIPSTEICPDLKAGSFH
jgi:hypothetical protein